MMLAALASCLYIYKAQIASEALVCLLVSPMSLPLPLSRDAMGHLQTLVFNEDPVREARAKPKVRPPQTKRPPPGSSVLEATEAHGHGGCPVLGA